MASELAKKIYQLEWGQIDVIDAELSEVREVMDLLQNLPYQQPPCFCRIAWQQGHDGPCQRARALYEKLLVTS